IQDIMVSIKNMSPTDNEFQVVESSGNNGNYILSNIGVDLTNARRLKLTVDSLSPTFPIPSATADGFFKIQINSFKPTLQPTVLDANTADNYFTVDKNLFRVVFPGATIHINSGPDVGYYTVVKVVDDGLNSLIYVKEKIVDTNPLSPTVDYTLMLPITAVDQANNFFYITPGADEVAAHELADWVKAKFFSHEGMHVVEHVLLRPKYNTLGPAIPISSANNNELQNVTPAGNATFIKQFTLLNVDQSTKTFTIGGNFAGDVQPLQSMRIVGSSLNDGTYTIRSATNVGTTTEIKIYQNIPDGGISGSLQYSKTFSIISAPIGTQIVINDPFFVEPANNEVIITGSLDEINDGKFTSNPPSQQGGTIWKINFIKRVEVIKDNFLPVDIDNDCGFCRFDNPYSYIVSIVLPAWQGRFVNRDFRKFFDRTLRLECPAHLVLNICWIECKQMGEFELKYKKWLVENAKFNQDKSQLSKDLNSLIDVINQLRSVYPEGTLHDCESDSGSGEENAIILNNTVLGTL
ncbi:MAG TPA: hypothetical protein VFJ43_16435, partial [Bacteroidia bacterium]|nr:hypothetical protein [Bacteroidia bacterium]